jgi:hypothetical protein
VIELNPDGHGEEWVEPSTFDLLKSEAPSDLGLKAVSNRLCLHNWLKHGSWASLSFLLFLLPSQTPLVLAGWLVEPGLDVVLPLLVEMPIRQHVVVLDHF